MLTIRQVIKPMQDGGLSKYRIAKNLGVQSIMIDHYLTGKCRTPTFRVCKKIYEDTGLVTFPYSEEELQEEHEQRLFTITEED
jgi:predicted transcriptional regulator